MRLIFDIETDNLLKDLTKLHCICIINADYPDQSWSFPPENLKDGLDMLMEADEIIGHNILQFDIPAINKVFPDIGFPSDKTKITDTLIMSRLMRANIKELDWKNIGLAMICL